MLYTSSSIALLATLLLTGLHPISGQVTPSLTANGSMTSATVQANTYLNLDLISSPGLGHYWVFDTDPGPVTILGQFIPIGFSTNVFDIGLASPMPASGQISLSMFLTVGHNLIGSTWYSAAATLDPAAANGFLISNGVSVTFDSGPVNPVPPDAIFVGTKTGSMKGLQCLNTADMTTDITVFTGNTQAPLTYNTTLTGNVLLSPGKLLGSPVLGATVDMEIGAFLNQGLANNITNPPRGSSQTPGVPDPPWNTTPYGLLDLVLLSGIGAPQPPLGNFLYVIDADSDTVRVFDSHTFRLLTTMTGIPSPSGLGITPDLQHLYVSSFTAGTVTRIFADPAHPLLHNIANVIPVGAGPTEISVQPANEDVLVANFGENTVSIIDTNTQAERLRINTGLGPTGIAVTHRMLGLNLTNAYLAYITNAFDSTVTIYESDSPYTAPTQGSVIDTVTGFANPTACTWNWNSYVTLNSEPGSFVVDANGTAVHELTLFQWSLWSPSGLSGIRRFHIRQSFDSLSVPSIAGAAPSDVTIDAHSGLYNVYAAGIANHKGVADPIFNGSGGGPAVILVSFPTAGKVVCFRYDTGQVLSEVSVPGCDMLHSYFDQ